MTLSASKPVNKKYLYPSKSLNISSKNFLKFKNLFNQSILIKYHVLLSSKISLNSFMIYSLLVLFLFKIFFISVSMLLKNCSVSILLFS